MQKSLALGGVLGGLVLFVWGVVSYMVLPWHTAVLSKFADEAAVARALTANTLASGMHILPNPHKVEPGMTEAHRQAAEEDGVKRMMQGPFMFASVGLTGARDMGQAMGLNVLGNILSATLVTWLLLQTSARSYWGRVGFVVVLAFTTCTIAYVPYWIWWNFSTGFTLVEFADHVIGWFLVGLVLTKFATLPSPLARS
jgi:hypothetical protein